MSRHDPRTTPRQIADHAARAQDLCIGLTVNDLRRDWQRALALERIIEVLGEAVKRLPAALRERHPEIPWKGITGTRDRLIHGYDAVDHEILLTAVREEDIPSLLKTVATMLREESAEA